MVKEMKLIYLEWEDAVARAGWNEKKEVEEFANDVNVIKEIGWVFSEDKRNIVLVSRISTFIGSKEISEYGLLQKIPKTWIRKRKVIKI